MILSISLIFLISLSFVSAGFWDWLTGDVTGKVGLAPTSVSSDLGSNSRTSTSSRFGAAGNCPRGWDPAKTIDDKDCCTKQTGRELFKQR